MDDERTIVNAAWVQLAEDEPDGIVQVAEVGDMYTDERIVIDEVKRIDVMANGPIAAIMLTPTEGDMYVVMTNGAVNFQVVGG